MNTRTLEIMVGGTIPVAIGAIKSVRLIKLLGAGGFGSAWKVVDPNTGLFYALKIVQAVDPDSVTAARVRMEAEVDIRSDHIVHPIGLCEWDNHTFLILFEYFEAETLSALLSRGKLKGPEKKEIFRQLAQGVAAAHAVNVIHRDLKPDNILVGKGAHVKIIDFGIAKFKEGKGAAIIRSITGAVLGTLPYIAPELIISGAKKADARADIYSLGQILYELVMGHTFWEREGWSELRDLIGFLTRKPAPTEVIDLDGFECDYFDSAPEILTRMVKINPDERYSSVTDVLIDLGCVPLLPDPPADVTLPHPLFVVESGTNRGAQLPLSLDEGQEEIFGRTHFAGADESISRRHLRVRRSGGRYFVQDVGSKNGTLLRGTSLPENGVPAELKHADRLRVGDIFLRFAVPKKR